MNCEIKNGSFVIYLDERIDTANAQSVSDATEGFLAQNTDAKPLVLDAEKLGYISSSGLRIVLNLRKKNPDMKVINVCADVYDIFDMTGFTEIITVEKAYRRFSVDGCTVIGQGAKGTVYRYDGDTIVKVYKNPDSLPDIKKERELARRAFVLGIPTAISYDVVKVGDSFGSVFELLDAKSYSVMIRDDEANRDKYIGDYTQLLRKIHSTQVRAEDMPDFKIQARGWVKLIKPFFDDADGDKLEKLVEDVPDTMNMLHCDYHTNNVMYQNGETLLIDMDTLSHGHPVFDLANVYITYVGFGEEDPTVVEKFMDMPYDLAKYIWEKFLPQYLDTTDEKRIADVESKVRLLSYVRMMRHTVRRGGADNDKGRKTIAYCRANIEKLLESVDTLDF